MVPVLHRFRYLWPEQAAAHSVPQTSTCTLGFPLSRIGVVLQAAAGLIQTLLSGITVTHPYWHEPVSLLKCLCVCLKCRGTGNLLGCEAPAVLKQTRDAGTSGSRLSLWPHRREGSSLPAGSCQNFHYTWFHQWSVCSRGLRQKNKGTQPVDHAAFVLFYCPDGFGGLTPENPLLPSLAVCSRLLLLLLAVRRSTHTAGSQVDNVHLHQWPTSSWQIPSSPNTRLLSLSTCLRHLQVQILIRSLWKRSKGWGHPENFRTIQLLHTAEREVLIGIFVLFLWHTENKIYNLKSVFFSDNFIYFRKISQWS